MTRTRRGDDSVTVGALRDRVRAFVAEREWERFHSPKNLVMALACEAAELMEPYLWLGTDESRALTDEPRRRAAVEAEVADVAICLLNLCNVLGVDLGSAVERKLEETEKKYPVARARGRADKYDQLRTARKKRGS